MDAFLSALVLGILGYIVQEIRHLRKDFNSLENRLIIAEMRLPKRKDDDNI